MSNNKRFGGKVQFTYQVLNDLLLIPDECRIVSVFADPNRDVASVVFHTDEAIPGLSTEVNEGAEYMAVSFPMEDYALKMLKAANDVRQNAADGHAWAQYAVTEFESNE